MSFFAISQKIVLLFFTLTLLSLESAKAQDEDRSEYQGNNRLMDNDDDSPTSDEDSEQEMDLDPETLEQARRTISHLSPETRRFLFSPTIQNTITNLNQNTNTQEFHKHHGGSGKTRGSSKRTRKIRPEILGYLNSKGDLEYDIRGKVKRICFVLG